MACRLFDTIPLSHYLNQCRFSAIWIRNLSFLFKKMHLNMSSAKLGAILSRGRWVTAWSNSFCNEQNALEYVAMHSSGNSLLWTSKMLWKIIFLHSESFEPESALYSCIKWPIITVIQTKHHWLCCHGAYYDITQWIEYIQSAGLSITWLIA